MQVLSEQTEWRALETQLMPYLSPRGLTPEDLRWALACVRSRTFEAPLFPFPGSLLKGVAGGFAALAVALAVTSQGDNLLAAGAAAVLAVAVPGGLLAWQAARAGKGGGVMYAIAPYIDLVNHSSQSQVW